VCLARHCGDRGGIGPQSACPVEQRWGFGRTTRHYHQFRMVDVSCAFVRVEPETRGSPHCCRCGMPCDTMVSTIDTSSASYWW